MKTITINLNKIARNTLCRKDGRKCITGYIAAVALGVPEDMLVDGSTLGSISSKVSPSVRKWIYKHDDTLFQLLKLNDTNHDSWDVKKEKMRPLIKKLGYSPRFIR